MMQVRRVAMILIAIFMACTCIFAEDLEDLEWVYSEWDTEEVGEFEAGNDAIVFSDEVVEVGEENLGNLSGFSVALKPDSAPLLYGNLDYGQDGFFMPTDPHQNPETFFQFYDEKMALPHSQAF